MNVLLTVEQKIFAADSEELYKVMRQILTRDNGLDERREHFWVVGLNNVHYIDYIELISPGSVDKLTIKPLDVLSLAAQKKCPKIVLIWTTTEGNYKVNNAGMNFIEKIRKGAETLEIRLGQTMIMDEDDFLLVPTGM